MARKTKSPSTLYLVVGMIPLIPGAALYYMMRNAIQTNFKMFAERGLEAVITGGAIASGIITAMVCWNVIKLNLLKKFHDGIKYPVCMRRIKYKSHNLV